jgi:hypothetical protein
VRKGNPALARLQWRVHVRLRLQGAPGHSGGPHGAAVPAYWHQVVVTQSTMRPDVGRATDEDERTRLLDDAPLTPPDVAATPREALIQQLVQWQHIEEATIQLSQVDYSAFPGFWDDSCGQFGITNHRDKYQALLKAAVEQDDAEQLARLLQLPIRADCTDVCNWSNLFASTIGPGPFDFAPGTPTFDPFEKSGVRALSKFTKTRRLVKDGANAIRRPHGAFLSAVLLYTLLWAIYLTTTILLSTGVDTGQVLIPAIFCAIGTLCCMIFIFKPCWRVTPSCFHPRSRQRHFNLLHDLHRCIFRMFGPECFWRHCSGRWDLQPAKVIVKYSCDRELCGCCCLCNEDPLFNQYACCCCCDICCCRTLRTEVEQFIIRQQMLEQRLNSETLADGQSILDIAVERRHPNVVDVLRPHGIQYLLAVADITARSTAQAAEVGAATPAQIRYTQGHLALNAAIGVAAVFADVTYRGLHEEVLRAQGHAISVDAPSQYIPPAAKPCARDGHVPSAQPNCQKCRSRTGCESQDSFAASFAALHPGGLLQMCWTNCDARKWATPGCHIEMAKAFCRTIGPHEAASSVSSFDKLDGSALFNMLSWCKSIDSDYTGAGGAAQAAANARNVLKHDDSLALSERQYDTVFAGLSCFLERVSEEDNAEVAARARTALSQLNVLSRAHQMQVNMIHNRSAIDVAI